MNFNLDDLNIDYSDFEIILIDDRSEDGTGNPMCVEKCPMHAITVEEVK
mgnify:CR=1 FL=1